MYATSAQKCLGPQYSQGLPSLKIALIAISVMQNSFLIILKSIIITRNEAIAVLGGAKHSDLMVKKNSPVDLNKSHIIHVEHT